MNEHIDILLTSAKIASRNNPWANLATHSISMAYNISMIGRYGYQLGVARTDNGYVSQEYLRSIQREDEAYRFSRNRYSWIASFGD